MKCHIIVPKHQTTQNSRFNTQISHLFKNITKNTFFCFDILSMSSWKHFSLQNDSLLQPKKQLVVRKHAFKAHNLYFYKEILQRLTVVGFFLEESTLFDVNWKKKNVFFVIFLNKCLIWVVSLQFCVVWCVGTMIWYFKRH